MSARPPIISDAEIRKLGAALRPSYPDGIPESVVERAYDWLVETRVDYAMWQLIERGEIEMTWDAEQDDWVWRMAS